MKELGTQFTKFVSVGVLNTMVDMGVYFALTRYTDFFSLHLTTSKTISYIVALTFSYFANSLWTFRSDFTQRKLVTFYFTVGSGVFINVGVHYLFIDLLAVNDLLSVLVAAGGTAIWGFSLAKIVVFKK